MLPYKNFDLQITALDKSYYSVRADATPEGIGAKAPSHSFSLATDEATLDQIIKILSREQSPARGTTREAVAQQFGESLFKAVFAGEVHKAYQTARLGAEAGDYGLRMRFNLNRAGRLAHLPWEFLRDPEADFLAVSRSTPIIRNSQQFVKKTLIQTPRPLRILVMISAPIDLEPIDEAAERRQLERATYNLQQQGLVEIEYLEDASLRNLQRVLRQGEYHVFHYIGHGAYDVARSVGYLMLEDPHGTEKSYPVRGEALARELHEEDTMRLVVLNTCHGAQADVRDPFSGVASSLIQRGIPAVVAQQFEITDQAAVIFSEEFYRTVAEGFSIEAAVAEGRRAIFSTLGTSEWATPVLFLHENHSERIFNFPPLHQKPIQQVGNELLLRRLALAATLILFLGVVLLSGFVRQDNRGPSAFPPPSVTPIPDVDLIVRDLRISPRNPQPGALAEIFIEIENLGTDPAPPFNYEWQASIFDPSSIVRRRVGGLAAGGLYRENLSARMGWWGVFISEARVDTSNEIVERSEQNSRPMPIRTSASLPFIINFSEALPNGALVRENRPLTEDEFSAWGFEVRAISDDPECDGVVPWFKFVGISRVALGTGLPSAPNLCDRATLIINFPEVRADSNPIGVGTVGADFGRGAGMLSLRVYADPQGENILDEQSIPNSPSEDVVLVSDPNLRGFDPVMRAEIVGEGAPLHVMRLVFSAP